MNLIGRTLKHISNGLGIVEDIQQDKIWVRFCNSNKGEIVSKFMIPYAFEKKFLVPIDDETANIIIELIDKFKCFICGSTNSPSEIIDKIRVCLTSGEEFNNIYKGLKNASRDDSENASVVA